MNRNTLMRRLGVVAALVAVLAVAAGTPVLQAQPETGTISTGAGVEVWNGHNCPANVPVGIADLSAGLGGYETKIGWDAGRFNNTPANVGVTVSSYLAFNGRTNSSAGGTPPLKAVVGDTVKFGDYSWGAGNPAGNMANGRLATVSLLPTAICGAASLTMAETQLVDINGTVITLTGQNGSQVTVFNQFDTTGGGLFINSSDVLAVVDNLGPRVAGCNPGYQYDANADNGFFINSADVLAVVDNLGPVGCQ